MRCHLLTCALFLTLVAGASRAGEPVTMTVSPAGEIALTLAGRTVASGAWHLRPDVYLPVTDPTAIAVGAAVSTTATQEGSGRFTVHEQRASATADYTLTLTGEDLRITAHVVNTDATHALKPIGFIGLTFHFNPAVPATGQMNSWHWTYLQAQGSQIFHPGLLSPVGCWWAGDDRFAFAAFSESEFDHPALIEAEYAGRDGVIPPECQPTLFTSRGIPPGRAADFSCSFRVTADRSLPHLIGGYKAVYDRRFPLPMYAASGPGAVAMFTEADQNHVTPANPLGYHSLACRFDTVRGTAAYVRRFPGMERRVGILGHIFWSPGGYDPPMYPPDFDVLPPSVQSNIPTLVKGFNDQGIRVGLCARPADGVLRPPGGEPTTYRLSADNPEQMRACTDRFRHAMAMGFDMFYLDSIGSDGLNDAQIIRRVRDAVGPGVLLYSEYCTDLSLPYAGRYCEWTGEGGIQWNSIASYNALRILCPHAPWICVSRTRQPVPPEFGQLGLTPLVHDGDVPHLPLVERP